MASDRIELVIAGTPKARPRPRHGARIMGKGAAAKAVSFSYQPTKIRYKDGKPTAESLAWARAQEWYATVAAALIPHKPAQPWDGPVKMTIDVFFARPQRLLTKKSPQGPMRHTATPDRDNLEKSITDALKVAGLYLDDSQICAGEVRKWYVAKGCAPGVIIVAEQIAETEEAPT